MKEIDDFRNWIYNDIKKIPQEIYTLDDLILGFNKDGKKSPIYWCFNNWAEAVFLSRSLGADQPLFALKSTHGFKNGSANKKVYTNSLAVMYAKNILKNHEHGPIFIGGNCQAGPISEAVAHYLIPKVDKKPILITLEHQPFYFYPGHLVMLFGGASEKYNPFLHDENPIPTWEKKYSSYSWGIIKDAPHGKYFIDPFVLKLVAYIEHVKNNYLIEGKIKSGPIHLA